MLHVCHLLTYFVPRAKGEHAIFLEGSTLSQYWLISGCRIMILSEVLPRQLRMPQWTCFQAAWLWGVWMPMPCTWPWLVSSPWFFPQASNDSFLKVTAVQWGGHEVNLPGPADWTIPTATCSKKPCACGYVCYLAVASVLPRNLPSNPKRVIQ